MIRLLLRRLVLSISVLFVVSMLTYAIEAFIPGNPAQFILGPYSTPAAVALFNKSLGMDKPIYQRYVNWLWGVVHANLGRSVITYEPVSKVLNGALPISLTLILASVTVSLVVGVPLGVLSARKRGHRAQVVDSLTMLGFGLPAFWLGLVLVLLFADTLHVLPAAGWVNFGTSISGWLKSLVLPVVTLSAGGVAVVVKQTRDGMAEVLSREFVRALRSRGIGERKILYKHALRSALPNVVTIVSLSVVSLLLGTTVAESVFALQGLGTVAVAATSAHDLAILEGATLYFTLIIVAVFAIADVARMWLNPRLRERQ